MTGGSNYSMNTNNSYSRIFTLDHYNVKRSRLASSVLSETYLHIATLKCFIFSHHFIKYFVLQCCTSIVHMKIVQAVPWTRSICIALLNLELSHKDLILQLTNRNRQYVNLLSFFSKCADSPWLGDFLHLVWGPFCKMTQPLQACPIGDTAHLGTMNEITENYNGQPVSALHSCVASVDLKSWQTLTLFSQKRIFL